MPRLRSTSKSRSANAPLCADSMTAPVDRSWWRRTLRSQGDAGEATRTSERTAPQPVPVAPLGPMY